MKESDLYETPAKVFQEICEWFDIYPSLDVCATSKNKKCKNYFNQDALSKEWKEDFFMNPPYSEAKKWVQHAYFQHVKHNVTGLAILQVSTGSKYWHDYIFGKAEIAWCKGRIPFELNGVPCKSPRYDSVMICWAAQSHEDIKDRCLRLFEHRRKLEQNLTLV